MKVINPRNIERLFRVFILIVCLTFPTVLSLPVYGGKRYIRSSIYYPQPQRNLQWTPLPFAAYQPRVTRYYSPYSQDYSVEDYYPQAAYYYQPSVDDASNYNPYYYVDRPAGYYSYEQDPYEDDSKFDDYDFAERGAKPKSAYPQRQWFDDGMVDNSDANERFVQNLIDSQMLNPDANSGTVIFAPAQSSKATGASRRDNDSPITYGTKKLSKYDDATEDEEEQVRELKSLIHDNKKAPKKHDHSDHSDEQNVYIAERDGVYDLPQSGHRGNTWTNFMSKKNALKPLPPLSRAHPDLFDDTVHHVSDRKLNSYGHPVTSSGETTTTGPMPVKKGQKEVVYQRSATGELQKLALNRPHNQNPSVIDTIKSLLSLEDSLNKADDSGRPKKRSLVTSEESLVKELGALRKKENYFRQ